MRDPRQTEHLTSEANQLRLLLHAAEVVITNQFGSVSLLQRRVRVGFATAARLMDQLHQAGVVGPSDGTRSRDVLVRPKDMNAALDSLRANGVVHRG